MTENTKTIQELKQTPCCDDMRIMCDELFSYEVDIAKFEGDKNNNTVFVDTNDYCTDGYSNFQCVNCGCKVSNEDALEFA